MVFPIMLCCYVLVAILEFNSFSEALSSSSSSSEFNAGYMAVYRHTGNITDLYG